MTLPKVVPVVTTPSKLEAEKIAGWIGRAGVPVWVDVHKGEWGVLTSPPRFSEARHVLASVIRRNPGAIGSVGAKLATDIIGGIGFGIGAGITERYIMRKNRKNPRRAGKNIFLWNNGRRRKKTRRNIFLWNPNGYDADAARELELYIENDADLYRQQYLPIIKNLMTKRARGVFDPHKAAKLFMYLMESGAKKYAREFGGPGVAWHAIFSKPTREAVAKRFVESFVTEADLGNYDRLLPKKYQKRNPLHRTRRNIAYFNPRRGEKRLWRVPVRYTSPGTGRMVRDIFFMTARSAAEAKEAAHDTIRHDGLEPGEVGRPKGLKSNPRQSLGRYARERVRSPKAFAKGSLRTVTRGKHRVIVGCPVGKYDRKRNRCRVGTRAQSVLHPMGEAFRLTREGRKITIGRGPTERRITRAVARRKIAANPQEGEFNYVVFGWSRDPNIGQMRLAGYDGTLRFKKRADAIRLAKDQLKGVYDRTWVESVVYHKSTGWTSFDIVWDERKRGNPRRRARCNPRSCNNPRHRHRRNPLLQTVLMNGQNPLTRRESGDLLRRARSAIREAVHQKKFGLQEAAQRLTGIAEGLTSTVSVYGPKGARVAARKLNTRIHRAEMVIRRNPSRRSKRRTMTTRAVTTVKRTVVGNPRRPPWKHGQRIPIAQARAWVNKYGSPELRKQFAAAERLQAKANKKARYVRWNILPIGSTKKLDAVTAMVHYGSSPETMYKPPRGSKKGNVMYRHEWGDGSGRTKAVPVLATPGGRAMVMPLRKGQTINDWMRG